MSSSEHEVSDTTLRPAHEQSAHRGRLGKWLPVAVVTAVVVALVAVLLLLRAGVFTTSQLGGSGGAPSTWQTYHDPSGLFSLRLPPGWTVRIEPAAASYGDSRGSVQVHEEMVTFGDPAQGTGSAHFWVVADPIKTAFDRQHFCQYSTTLQSFSTRNLSGMEHTGALWLFTTENANFQIDVAIPGVLAPGTFGPPQPTATPLPATWVATDKTEVNAMLVSFQPTDPKPLAC